MLFTHRTKKQMEKQGDPGTPTALFFFEENIAESAITA